jgi:flagellar biosynthetic protein FlhB
MPEQSGEKSFDPTPHRRQQAREQGQVAYSQDLGSAALLVVGAMVLMYWGGAVVNAAGWFMEQQLSHPGDLGIDEADAARQAYGMLRKFGAPLLPVLGALLVAGVMSTVLQIGLLFNTDRLQPDLSRISLLGGMKRILSLQGIVRLGFGLFKILIVSVVAGAVLYRKRDAVLGAADMELPDLAQFLADVMLSTALWVGAALFVLAILDYGFQRWRHEQDLRMTHQEIREEMKNLQGDPSVIARRKAIQRQMAMNRIGDKVPKADVVVTNPTELAVAIQYDPLTMAAPVVLAKGAGVLAQRIRRLALENDIPVVERKPLAQALYKDVAVNHPVPDSSYAAVAEVLAYVYQLKRKQIPLPQLPQQRKAG